jgi:hypothetical protein
MDETPNIRRASEQLRSVEEIQRWLGIPWSRVDRRFIAIDNRERSADLVSAITPYTKGISGQRLSIRAVSANSVYTRCALGDDTAIRTFKCKIAKAATGIVAAFIVLMIASYSERTEPLARTARRTEKSLRDLSPDK